MSAAQQRGTKKTRKQEKTRLSDAMAYLGQIKRFPHRRQIHDSARGAHDNVGHLGLEGLEVALDVDTAIEHAGLDIGEVLAEPLVLALNLKSQLASVAQHDHVHLARDWGELVQRGEHEDGRFAHA